MQGTIRNPSGSTVCCNPEFCSGNFSCAQEIWHRETPCSYNILVHLLKGSMLWNLFKLMSGLERENKNTDYCGVFREWLSPVSLDIVCCIGRCKAVPFTFTHLHQAIWQTGCVFLVDFSDCFCCWSDPFHALASEKSPWLRLLSVFKIHQHLIIQHDQEGPFGHYTLCTSLAKCIDILNC